MIFQFTATIFPLLLLFPAGSYAQYAQLDSVACRIDFSRTLREWDGFGVAYLQTAHTSDYREFPQDIGGFSLLNETAKDSILQLIFGDEGLRPALVKIMLDPLHQEEWGGPFDHLSSTESLLEFAERGFELTRQRGAALGLISTLHAPPAYTTLQRSLRGRDLDPSRRMALAEYLIDWVYFLRNERRLPLKYVELHQGGDNWRSWPADGTYPNFNGRHPYHLFWRPEEIIHFLNLLPPLFQEEGLEELTLSPGAFSGWLPFSYGGYARALMNDEAALQHLSLITAHQARSPEERGSTNLGMDWLRQQKQGLKAWVTSAPWPAAHYTDFIRQIHLAIYQTKINAYIPEQIIIRPGHWLAGECKPSAAIEVEENGRWNLQPVYYWYKQLSRAGQPGMGVAYTESRDPVLQLMAFSSNGSSQPDAFIVNNPGISEIGQSDGLSIWLNGIAFRFSHKDPMANRGRSGQYEGLAIEVKRTEHGYLSEIAIPWRNAMLPEVEPGKTISLNLKIQEGAYTLAGEREWRKNGQIVLESASDTLPFIQQVSTPVMVDGRVEASWFEAEILELSEPTHPNTDQHFKATWRSLYDENNLYLLVDIQDESNLQGRRLAIDLEGTSHETFKAYRSSESGETYYFIGTFKVVNGVLEYEAPSRSVSTFFGQ